MNITIYLDKETEELKKRIYADRPEDFSLDIKKMIKDKALSLEDIDYISKELANTIGQLANLQEKKKILEAVQARVSRGALNSEEEFIFMAQLSVRDINRLDLKDILEVYTDIFKVDISLEELKDKLKTAENKFFLLPAEKQAEIINNRDPTCSYEARNKCYEEQEDIFSASMSLTEEELKQWKK